MKPNHSATWGQRFAYRSLKAFIAWVKSNNVPIDGGDEGAYTSGANPPGDTYDIINVSPKSDPPFPRAG